MRGLAVLMAASAAWLLVGASATVPRSTGAARIPRPLIIGMATLAGGGAWLTTHLLTAVPGIAAAAAALATTAPVAIEARGRRRQRQELIDGWPDFLARVRGFLAGGQSLPEAFAAAGDQAGGVLARLSRDVSTRTAHGTTFADSLEQLRAELADPTTDRVVMLLAVAHHSGGTRVSEVLATAGRSIADEVRLRKAHESALTQQRLTALVALLAPWVLLISTVATNEAAALAYRTATGQKIVVAGLVATGAGYLAARSAARLSRPRRIYR